MGIGATDQLLWNSRYSLSCHGQGEWGRKGLVAVAGRDLRNALYTVNETSSFNKCTKSSFVFCSQVYVLILQLKKKMTILLPSRRSLPLVSHSRRREVGGGAPGRMNLMEPPAEWQYLSLGFLCGDITLPGHGKPILPPPGPLASPWDLAQYLVWSKEI